MIAGIDPSKISFSDQILTTRLAKCLKAGGYIKISDLPQNILTLNTLQGYGSFCHAELKALLLRLGVDKGFKFQNTIPSHREYIVPKNEPQQYAAMAHISGVRFASQILPARLATCLDEGGYRKIGDLPEDLNELYSIRGYGRQCHAALIVLIKRMITNCMYSDFQVSFDRDEVRIVKLPFSVRLKNCLSNVSICTLNDLPCDLELLLEIPGFGRTTLLELREFLKSNFNSYASNLQMIEGEIDLTRYPMSTKLRNCLNSAGIKFAKDLPKDREKIFQYRSFGKHTIADLCDLLKRLANGTRTKYDQPEISNFSLKKLRIGEVRIRDLFENHSLLTIKDLPSPLEQLLAFKNCGTASIQRLREELSKLQELGPTSYLNTYLIDDDKFNADKLHDALNTHLRKKDMQIAHQRFVRQLTLKEIGSKFNNTRERIRQISRHVQNIFTQVFWHENKVLAKLLINHFQNTDQIKLDVSRCAFLKGSDDNVKLLLIMIANQLPSIAVCKNALWKKDILEAKSDWSLKIRRALTTSSWPIFLESIFSKLAPIPEVFIKHYFNTQSINFNDRRITEIPNLFIIEMSRIALETKKGPMHIAEIRAAICRMFKKDIDENVMNGIISRDDNILIVGRGTYCLYKHLPLTNKQIKNIEGKIWSYLNDARQCISAKILYENLFRRSKLYKNINAYVILGISQDCPKFTTKRGQMIGLKSEEIGGKRVIKSALVISPLKGARERAPRKNRISTKQKK